MISTLVPRSLARQLALAAITFAAAAASFAVPTNMKPILLMGQSNMAGRGLVEAQDQVTDSHVYMLHPDDSGQLVWMLAIDPVHFDKPTLDGVGLCSKFARMWVAAHPTDYVGLVPCAYGGTSLDQWMPDAAPLSGEKVNLYNTAMARAQQASANGTITAILWHQGEADSDPSQVATYPDRFASLMGYLRADLSVPNVPIIAGELGTFYSGAATFNPMLPNLVLRVPRCDFATSENLTHKGDYVHFDSPSLRTYGPRYYAVFVDVKTWLNYEMESRTPTVSGGTYTNVADNQAGNGQWTKFLANGVGSYLQATNVTFPSVVSQKSAEERYSSTFPPSTAPSSLNWKIPRSVKRL